jgi:hypothetical protein
MVRRSPPRRARLAARRRRLIPLGADVREQGGRGFVVGILVDELPFERPFEDGLTETSGFRFLLVQ